jgi:hypothetical protein
LGTAGVHVHVDVHMWIQNKWYIVHGTLHTKLGRRDVAQNTAKLQCIGSDHYPKKLGPDVSILAGPLTKAEMFGKLVVFC